MSLTQASDTENMQVKIMSDKQSKNGDEQMEGMSVSEEAAMPEFSDPAILFVRETAKIQYTKDELMKLREAPLSKRKPDFFDPSEVSPAILDPERWPFDRKKSESSSGETSLRPDVAPPPEHRRRPTGVPADPRERVRKENDGIVLSPQRRSFNTGCFVPASSSGGGGGGGGGRGAESGGVGGAGGRGGRSHSPLGGKGDGSHLGIREIQTTNTRRIGSGRIMRDSWDFGGGSDKTENGGDGAEYGFRSGQQQHREGRGINDHRGGGEDKYEQRRMFDRDFGRDRGESNSKEGGGRRNSRYDRRRISDREQEEPEWFSCGPTSQNDTIELRGFDDGKKKLSPSRVRRAKEWSKKKNEPTQKPTDEKEEPKEAKGRSTPSPQVGGKSVEQSQKRNSAEKKVEKQPSDSVGERKKEEEVKADATDHGFNLDDFLKCDTIPGLLTNGVGTDEENTKSRFSRWFNKPDSPEKTSSRRSSTHDDQPSIIKDLLKDIGNETSGVAMPGDSEAYFAPISPASNTGSVIGNKRANNHHQQPQHQSHPVNIMEMLQKGGSKQPPPAGKILSLDELESKMRQNVEPPTQKHQPQQKPDEEMAAAFKKLLAQAQAGVHPVTSNGPMNKQPMSLLEMLNHSQQQDEAARLTGNRLGPHHQHQQPVGGDLAMKLQQAQQLQQQKQQMEMLNKLINATTGSMHAQQQQQMRVSPLQDLGMQQSRELLNRPEAQAILQGLKRGEITTQHLYQQLANPALQPRHRDMLSTVLKMQGAGYGPSPRALSPQPAAHYMFQQQQQSQQQQQQLSVSPLPSVNAYCVSPILATSPNTLSLPAMHQRIPSPRELQVHTQNILQRALIKKKLEEQQENYRKKQEMQQQQRGLSPSANGAHQGAPGQGKNVHSPTPLAFTPTSVLRKMTADKDEGKENKGMIDGKIQLGRAVTGVRPQPVQPQGQQWNPQFPSMKHQAGRPIVKANNHYQTQTPEQFFSQHQAQQQRMFNQPPPPQQQQQQQRSKPQQQQQQFAPVGGQGAQYNPQSYNTNQQFNPQQLRAQHQHRSSNQPPQQQQTGTQPQQQQQATQQQRGQQIGFQQPPVGGGAWQQFFGSGQPGPRTGPPSPSPLSPSPSSTVDQLSRWFSPDLLERARGGELPSTAALRGRGGAATSLEEIERQAAAAQVRN
ncbi:unnamed protein product [Phaedon cochleariae]|uniref:Eukaryotic translation initiation factor 4E transporter n=1 Tax=Phaedon cochleariae TaxID=80249 RepID=A0A9N9S9S6_PHACE|nr:unnamed protein product [Phaedon cochleariae]